MGKFFLKIFHFPRHLKKMFYKRWNKIKFWLCGISYGKGLNVMNFVYIEKEGNSSISIGDSFSIISGDALNPLVRNCMACLHTEDGAEITIGNHSGLSGAVLWAKESISIGNNVKIGANSIILDNDAHSIDFRIRRTDADCFSCKSAPIVIEDDVLIGTNTIVLKGVRIGARTIIGGGSVVTKSIPADSIAAGNPCKVIRKLCN